MEDLTINISTSEEAGPRPGGEKNISKKRKGYLRKMRLLKTRQGGPGPRAPRENRAVSHPSRPLSSTSSLPVSTHHPKPKASPGSPFVGPGSGAPTGSGSRPSTVPPAGPSSRPSVAHPAGPSATLNPTRFLAMDCEMVGTGPKGSVSQLARCSIVSYDGDVVYDKFVRPPDPVTDYRTRWSGIRPRDLVKATPFPQAKKEVLRLLQGKVVIGHAVHNDFRVLGYCHPPSLTRDTSHIPLLNQKAGFAPRECASLKRLTKAIFNRDIQTGRKGHSSVEDAKACMELYKVVEDEWERHLASKSSSR